MARTKPGLEADALSRALTGPAVGPDAILPPHGERYIEYVPLATVSRARENPKGHAGGVIRASLGRFGYVEPMVLDERTNTLVVGHGRLDQLQAAADAGEAPPQGVRRDEGGAWLVPVLRGWASADDQEAAAYLITSNETVILGGWDLRGLHERLAFVVGDGDPAARLVGTGYDGERYGDLGEMFRAPTLAELERRFGTDVPEDAFGQVIRFRVPPELRRRFHLLLAQLTESANDADRVEALCQAMTGFLQR